MSKPKVCASVSADTASAVIAKIREASAVADLIEIRFDHVRHDELEGLVRDIGNSRFEKPLIATFRSPRQGGKAPEDLQSRRRFWEKLGNSYWAVDLEEDVFDVKGDWPVRILSFHDFSGCPDDLSAAAARLTSRRPDVLKIAYTAADATDTLPAWRLLRQSEDGTCQVVAIAMGEAGKMTRILGPIFGSAWTYGSVGRETAPGQIQVEDLSRLYRVGHLDRSTQVFGIIGNPVAGSLSPRIHNTAFSHVGINAVFMPLLVRDLEGFLARMVKPETREVNLNFSGFAVTMPHKQRIISLLDSIDETAAGVGAVNTVSVIGGQLSGFNTDVIGFIEPLLKRLGSVRNMRVAVLGAGGAARACIYALKNEGAHAVIMARDPRKAAELGRELAIEVDEIDPYKLSSFEILVNATPVGMIDLAENWFPIEARHLEGLRAVYDLVTIPGETRLIRDARSVGIETIGGVEMLVSQAARQFEIWTGKKAPREQMEVAAGSPERI